MKATKRDLIVRALLARGYVHDPGHRTRKYEVYRPTDENRSILDRHSEGRGWIDPMKERIFVGPMGAVRCHREGKVSACYPVSERVIGTLIADGRDLIEAEKTP